MGGPEVRPADLVCEKRPPERGQRRASVGAQILLVNDRSDGKCTGTYENCEDGRCLDRLVHWLA